MRRGTFLLVVALVGVILAASLGAGASGAGISASAVKTYKANLNKLEVAGSFAFDPVLKGGNFIVGDGGRGYFNKTGGTLTSANELWVGQGGSATGQYDLSGTGSATVSNWVAVGRGGGTGVLNMFGGSFTKMGNGGNHFIIGAGGPGTINQTGGTITSVLSDTWVGESATGTWNLNGGSAILSVVHISQNSGTVGTLNLNGGTLSATEVTRQRRWQQHIELQQWHAHRRQRSQS